jgi:hypothetical protein
MKPHLLFWSVCLSLFWTTHLAAQPCDTYKCVMDSVSKLMNRREYESTLNHLNTAEAYLDGKQEQAQEKKVIQQWRVKVFKAIEQEKIDAQNARNEARKQADIAQKARDEAKKQADIARNQTEIAQKALVKVKLAQYKTEQTLALIHFYKNKFGLAYKDGYYGFINKQLDTMIEFKYTEALPFDRETGFAKVKVASDDPYLLIDTFGNEYKLATHWNQLDSNTIALDLSYQKLDMLPNEVFQHAQLKILSLRNNKITHLSDSIGLLTQLQCLDLGNNQLKQLPTEFGKLTQLKYLNLNNNQLQDLPNEFGNLINLQFLHLNYNKLIKCPIALDSLIQLQDLEFNSNKIAYNSYFEHIALRRLQVTLLEKKLQKEPNNLFYKAELNRTYNNWIWYELLNSDFEAAAHHAEQGIALKRDSGTLLGYLAFSLAMQDKYPQAEKLYLDLKRQNPRYGDTFRAHLAALNAMNPLAIPSERKEDVEKIKQLLAN